VRRFATIYLATKHWLLLAALLATAGPLLLWTWAAQSWATNPQDNAAEGSPAPVERDDMVWVPAGEFLMGGKSAPDQWPIHQVALDGYWIDRYHVTNIQFQEFVDATGYETTAEQRGSSLVFVAEQKQWVEVAGAHWRRPQGPDSSLFGLGRHPVVHVSHIDARAYAEWAGKRLPTEAEYERAARGGALADTYAWGNDLAPNNTPMANFWQGRFPHEDNGLDRFRKLAPVGRFAANDYGLLDMAGNAWCWTADGYDAEYYAISPPANPAGSIDATDRVLRGGSYLTPASGMAVSTRAHADPQHTAGDIGFRCAR
jgi:formylglycine-generating enzyme required for sulfatase activity